jgi:predicted nucleic acid-binding protein
LILVIDSFAWVEVIRDSVAGRQAKETIERAEVCLTPSIVLAEVASACFRGGFDDTLVTQELQSIREASTIVPMDNEIAMASVHATRHLRQSARSRRLPTAGLADGLVLATARRSGARLLTGDPHFRDCPETVWLG